MQTYTQAHPSFIVCLPRFCVAGASDDDYDPDEDAMAQEPCAVQQPASSDDDGQRGHDAGPARSEDPAVSQPRGDWDRRSRGPGRERWDEQGRGREGGAQDTKRAAAMNFQHRALVIGEKGGHSWLDRPLLHRYFSQYGQVLDVFTPRNGRAMAYVAFDTHEQLQRALNARHVISGCTVRLIRAEKVCLCCVQFSWDLCVSEYLFALRPLHA